MDARISAKLPGFCAVLVTGFALGLAYDGNYANAVICTALIIADCVKIEKR